MKIPKRINILFNLESFLILMYFISIILINQTNVLATKVFYYITICSFILPVLLKMRKRTPFWLIVLCLVVLGLGILNYLFIGNTNLLRLIIIITSILFAFIFYCGNVDTKCLLTAIFLNAAIIVYHFVLNGLTQPVYVESSNNFVSIHLLAPTVIYYSLLEKYQQNIPLFPAFLVWLLCFFGGGRGGFLVASILFVGLFFLKNFNKKYKPLWLIIILIFVLILSFAPFSFTQSFSDYRLVTQFQSRLMNDNGRFVLWYEYVSKSFYDLKNLLLGTELTSIVAAERFDYNLHNSFLFIHAYLGLIGLLLTFCLLINGVVFCIKSKKWVYLLCLISFSLRGATDLVFGAGRLSPVFVFLLFFPFTFHSAYNSLNDFVEVEKKVY